jgi:carboxyl-terminal processing protease
VELKSIDIKCGPNEEEIGVIIERVAVETDLAGMLKDLRQGISPDGNSLKKLVDELHLTQSSLLRLLTLLARSDTPPYQISTELAVLVKKHIALAQRADDMRQDDAILQNVSDEFYAAVAASDFSHAEALLRDYEVARSFKENADEAMANREEQHRQTLANMKKEETEARNLLKVEHDKAISELKADSKRETEQQVVQQQKVEEDQQQLAAREGTPEAPKDRAQASESNAQSQGQQRLSQGDVYEHLKLFTEVLSYMEAHHVNEITPKDVIYSAIHGLMKRGDPEGSFMSPEVYKEIQDGTAGRFAGVGLEITIRDDNLLVVAPLEDSPAFRGGIQPEDHIIKIDGVSTKGMTLIDAVRKLRGPEGTPLTLSILRKDATDPKDWTFTREFTVIRSVRWNMLQHGIAYIRLRNFHKTTAEELEDALQELDEENLRGLVLDLRNNPGGLLEQVLAVADRFLAGEKLIVYTKGRTASQNMKGISKPKVGYRDYPMIVLMNKGSAAGAEIVAGALQDLGRASILGTPTFGKGTIQTIIPLSNGAGLRLTTAQAFTPKGHSIHGRGIIPDITVELPKPKNVTEGKEASGVTVPPKRSHFGNLTTDVQLQRAVEMLRAKK